MSVLFLVDDGEEGQWMMKSTTDHQREMLDDVISPAPPLPEFTIEDISSPNPIALEFCDDVDFFLDNLDTDLPFFSPAACSISAATPASTATSSSGGTEGPSCYVDDNTSFTFDPAVISAIFEYQPYESNQLDITPLAAATYQLPVAPVYDQDYSIGGGCYPSFAPDSLEVQIPAGPPCQQMAPEYGEYLAPLAPMPGYAGLDTMASCSFLDASATNGYYPDAMGMGFFSRAMMIGLDPEMAAADGGVPMPEAVQSVYSSGDMQIMGDRQNLVGGCNSSNTKPLPTSEICALDNVCRLTAEQRKEKIHRYLKKRNERNFSKKIKYACRKTLADNRPRVRGRFAKNEELGEATVRACSSNQEYDDYEVGMKEDQHVLSPDTNTYQWCDLLEIQLQS